MVLQSLLNDPGKPSLFSVSLYLSPERRVLGERKSETWNTYFYTKDLDDVGRTVVLPFRFLWVSLWLGLNDSETRLDPQTIYFINTDMINEKKSPKRHPNRSSRQSQFNYLLRNYFELTKRTSMDLYQGLRVDLYRFPFSDQSNGHSWLLSHPRRHPHWTGRSQSTPFLCNWKGYPIHLRYSDRSDLGRPFLERIFFPEGPVFLGSSSRDTPRIVFSHPRPL